MQELIRSLDKTAEDHQPDEPHVFTELDDAAVKWATHALHTYDGDLLSKALAISKAMVEFTGELDLKR